jgi:hypothetical protein
VSVTMKTEVMKRMVIIGCLLASFAATAQESDPSINDQTWDIRCYPNPTSDLLIITSSLEIRDVSIIDLNGAVVKANPMPNWCFSLHDLPAGWLFVYIETTDGRIEKKNIYKQ